VKKAAVALIALLLFIVALWFVAIPESLIADVIENSLGRDYLYLKTEAVEKGLLYSFEAERILLKKKGSGEDSTLLVFNNVKGNLEPFSLFRLHPELRFQGSMNGGDVTGFVRMTGADSLMITADNVRMAGIPLLEPLGIYGDGTLSGSFLIRNNSGELKFSLRDAQLKSASVGGVFLPLDLFHDAKGAVRFAEDGAAEVQSFALTGTGIYARVKGTVRGRDMNMSLELMTDSSFAPDPLFRMMLERYKVSPGYYQIPLRGSVPRG
jgi:type II secretion system protein N